MTAESKVATRPAGGGERQAAAAPAVDRVDVLVIGGRCAGATLATRLARAGVSVLVADRARFPSDTLSTHVFQGGAIEALHRLGVLAAVLATGAPPVERGRISFANGADVLEAEVPMPAPAPGLPPMLCVRRVALDAILHSTAAEAGAIVLEGWALVELLEEAGRVSGARLRSRDGHERTVRAACVVGADGRNSSVASRVGARTYAVLPTERFGYFAYYEGVPRSDPALIDVARDERLFGFGVAADAGLYLACAMPPAADHESFTADVEASWDREIARLPRVGDAVAAGRRVGRPRGLRPVDTFLREPAGPGWALLGDAGHFKDPAPGQGIADAFRQGERLATEIVAGLEHGDVDRQLRHWGRWRDSDALTRHGWAHDFGAAGPPPHVLIQAQRNILGRRDAPERFWGPSMQRMSPREALGPAAVGRAAVQSVLRGRMTAAQALRELGDLARRALDYRRARRTAVP